MVSRRRTRSKAELDAAVEIRRIDSRGVIISQLVRWAGLVGCVGLFSYYGLYRTVTVLAGQTTNANIDFGMVITIAVTGSAGLVFGGGGIIYGWRQRRLRRDLIEEVGTHKAFLERQLDPNRSSSGLTKRGDTDPGDSI